MHTKAWHLIPTLLWKESRVVTTGYNIFVTYEFAIFSSRLKNYNHWTTIISPNNNHWLYDHQGKFSGFHHDENPLNIQPTHTAMYGHSTQDNPLKITDNHYGNSQMTKNRWKPTESCFLFPSPSTTVTLSTAYYILACPLWVMGMSLFRMYHGVHSPCTSKCTTHPHHYKKNTKHICASGAKMAQDVGMVWKCCGVIPI